MILFLSCLDHHTTTTTITTTNSVGILSVGQEDDITSIFDSVTSEIEEMTRRASDVVGREFERGIYLLFPYDFITFFF